MAYFFDKIERVLEFFQHRGSKLIFINLERNNYFFFDFQAVTLPIFVLNLGTRISGRTGVPKVELFNLGSKP